MNAARPYPGSRSRDTPQGLAEAFALWKKLSVYRARLYPIAAEDKAREKQRTRPVA